MQDLQEDYGSGSAMKTGVDGLEGQRPRLNHFSITGEAEIAFRRHCHPNRMIRSLRMPQINDFAVHDFANSETPLCG